MDTYPLQATAKYVLIDWFHWFFFPGYLYNLLHYIFWAPKTFSEFVFTILLEGK